MVSFLLHFEMTVLDYRTSRYLELDVNLTDVSTRNTLFQLVNFTCTPMGGEFQFILSL